MATWRHMMPAYVAFIAQTKESLPSVWYRPKSPFLRCGAARYDCPFMPPPAVAVIIWHHGLAP